MTEGQPVESRGRGSWCVCLSADEPYAFLLLMTLTTTARHHHGPLDVIVLADGLSEASQEAARAVAERAGWNLLMIEVGKLTGQLAATSASDQSVASRAGLARLFVADVLPDHYRRAIYLDVDVMVCSDLRPLAEVDLGGCVIAAVDEPGPIGDHVATFRSDGLLTDDRYFNAGVLVIDVERWRSGNESAGLAATISEVGDRARFGDQDYLNVHFRGRWCRLEPVWNVQSRHFYPRESRFRLRSTGEVDLPSLWRDRRIVHFNSPRRPWVGNSDHPGRPSYLLAWARSSHRSMPSPTGASLASLVTDRATFRSAIDVGVLRLGRRRRR